MALGVLGARFRRDRFDPGGGRYLLGTDTQGRDVLRRALYGTGAVTA